MTDPRALYDAHARDALKNPLPYLFNTFREHADRFVYVMKYVRELQPETIIDLACNLGLCGAMFRWTHGYAPKRITGVDISDEALAFAQTFSGYDAIERADVETWLAGEPADLVLCMEVLEHVANPARVVANALASSKGRVLFSVPEEDGEPDGTYHVRKVELGDLLGWITAAGGTALTWERIESQFCEKGHWRGWVFVLAQPGVKE